MIKLWISSIAAVVLFHSAALAQEGSGFSVGGVGTLGGTAASPVEENGWASLNDYRAARDCCSYTNTATDAQLWADAGNADANSPAQITDANCAAASYQALRSACVGAGGACQTFQRDTFLPMRDFNQQNPCLSPSYGTYADYQAAAAREFGLNQLDVNLVTEADTVAWDAYCPESDCSTAKRGQFLDAKAGKNLFLAALADAATASNNGSLTWAQLTAQYGSYQVTVSDPYDSAPERDWLMLYLNESANNTPNAMASATSPAGWDTLADAATANNSTVALWMIQRIQAGQLATSYLTGNLLSKAGLTSTYTSSGVVTQVVAAITDSTLTQASNVASAGSMQTWIDGLITATWDASPATSIAKVTNDVAASGAAVVTSSASLGGSGSLTYSLTGDEASSFSITSSGVVTTSASLAAGTFSFNVVASPQGGSDITKAFTVTVTDPAANIVASLNANTAVSTTDINNLVASQSGTVDSDLSLTSNPIHLSYVQACMQGKTDPAQLAACASNVDGADLNKYVVSEIASGAQPGTVTPAVLQSAGVSSAVAGIAAGNTCGPQNDQSCIGFISSALGTKAGVTTANIQNALVTYFDGQVTAAATSVADATLTTGCSGSSTTYQVPNPPSICATVHWNCTSNTTGISVVYNDQGKGNIEADSTQFTGNSYTVTATLSIGSATRTRTINGNFNVQQAIAGAQNGYKTGWQPAWWRGYDVIGRAKNTCNAWGGSITTYAEIQAANSQYNLIPNGTRTIFADANGNANRSTSGRSQCSEAWPQGPHSLRWYNSVLSQTCKGRAGFGRNFTFLCKDVPSC